MPSWRIRARAPAGDPDAVTIVRDRDRLLLHLEDAAHFPGGHADALVLPASEAAIARAVGGAKAVLPIGAQSSLTGGATPMGELVLGTARLNQIESIGSDRARVQAGVTLAALDEALARAGRSYPPAPTFTGAFIGGTLGTNAAGAATFKYGTTRDWVEALTIVLPTGDVLDIERGATRAHSDGYFELELARGIVRVPVPRYRMPTLQKLSAGYFAKPGMDLVDLFIGSEGTLGIITAATLRILEHRPATCLVLVPFSTRRVALEFVRRVRDAAATTWRTSDPRGVDVSAIEYMDERCLGLLREDGVDRAVGVHLPDSVKLALLVTLELPPDTRSEQVFDEIGRAHESGAPDTPLVRFLTILSNLFDGALSYATLLDHVAVAVPGDGRRAAQLIALREAIPAAVNQRVGLAKQTIDARIEKTAADMIVPFDKLESMLSFYDEEFRGRGLDAAVWGHISDGNVHPNVLPRSLADVESGKEAILAFGREAIRLGGAPLAEHGVGRSPVKQRLLRELYGDHGIEEMRQVKRAVDPEWKLAPGVLFN